MTIWPLNKLFGRTASREISAAPVRLCDRQAALLSFLNDPRDHHHIQLFLRDLEPREFCPRAVIEALNIFLACSGNRLDVYVPTGTPDRYYRQHHAFLKAIDQTTKAQLHEVSVDSAALDAMLGSHGQSYLKQERCVGVYMDRDIGLQAKLTGFFAGLKNAAGAVAPQPLQYS